MRTVVCLAMALACAGSPADTPGTDLKLERVVLVMRHGVRPPTKSAQAMASLSDRPWPSEATWGAAPGELTPHGAQAIALLGADLRRVYGDTGLWSTDKPLADQTLIWADGADQRTRETGKAVARGLMQAEARKKSATPIAVAWTDADPLFDGLNNGSNRLDPEAAKQAVAAQGSLDSAAMRAALNKMQAILAPDACNKGAGTCLDGASKLNVTPTEAKISGPLATGATVSEALLLEYENGLPMNEVGFGRATPEDIRQLLALHEHTSDLTRRTPYIATRRAAALLQFIANALSNNASPSTVPQITADHRMIVLVGHDTNLSNLAGALGLDWHAPDQPDVTAPGTTIAFERWRDTRSGATVLRVRLFYQDLEQLRNLTATPLHQIELHRENCIDAKNCVLRFIQGRP